MARATASAAELDSLELRIGRRRLERKARRYSPEWIAVVGIGAYRIAFDRPRAGIGPQPDLIQESKVWVLPNPSGLNANHQLGDLTRAFKTLRQAVDAGPSWAG